MKREEVADRSSDDEAVSETQHHSYLVVLGIFLILVCEDKLQAGPSRYKY